MIVCTNCNHQNPEGSVQCENCYAPLPKTTPCPHCGAFTQINAAFCGQCGYNLMSEEPLSFSSLDDEPERFLDSKETIYSQGGDSAPINPWDNDTEEEQNISATPTANLEEAKLAAEQEFAFDSDSEQDIFEPDLDLDLDLEAELPEMSDIDELEATTAKTAAEISEISEAFPSEDIVEPAEAEDWVEVTEFSPDSQSQQDLLEPDLDLDLEAELPEMSDIDELEATTAKTAAEISEISEAFPAEDIVEPAEAEDWVEVTEFAPDSQSQQDLLEPDLDLDLDLEAELPEMSDIDELEATTAKTAAEISEIAEPEPREELEITNPGLDPVAETPATAEPEPREELEITNPGLDLVEPEPIVTEKKPAVSNPLSLSQPIKPISESATQLQLERVILSHVQTGTDIELAQNLDIIRIGKPNSQIPPDIDVSDLPDANIVSRVHANIRVEGDNYFIEDSGSSNGTYINHKPLLIGNRHRLRFGDRISLGKGDLMTFIFKIIEE